MDRPIRLTTFLLVLTLGLCFLVTPARGQIGETRRVVVLSELGISAPAVAAIVRDLDLELKTDSTYRIEFYSEYLETALFPDEASQADIRAWFIRKYQLRKPDVIIAVGPTPTKFMVDAHERFFRGIPIVFCCTSEQQADYPKLDAHFTGRWLEFDTDRTLETAIRLLPRTEHVVVVGGVTDFDRHLEGLVEKTERKHEALQFTYLTNLPIETVLEQVKHLSDNTIILFTSVSADATGRKYNPNPELVRTLAAGANAPVFTLADTLVGQGAVGGYVVGYLNSGKPIAAITLRVLHGTRPQEIDISNQAGTYMFDWRALRRWGIKESDLPPGSVVLNQQRTFWEAYRRYVTAAILAFLSQALIIVGLLWQRAQKRKIQSELIRSNERLRLAMEVGKSVGWDWDIKGGRDTWFGDLQNMFGIPSETYVGTAEDLHRQHIHPEDRVRVEKAAKDAMESKTPYAAEYRILRPDGTVGCVAVKGKFYYSADGEPERMVGMKVDITERKMMEVALRDSEERLRLAAQAGKMYAFDWDLATDEILRSEEVNRLPGLAGEPISLTRQQLLTRMHPEDRLGFIASTAERTPESPNVQKCYRLLRPDGSALWLESTGHAVFDEQGKMVRFIGMVADITERKLAEEALSTVSQRLIEAHEEERTRIARELHDDINQRLALLAVNLEGIMRDPPKSAVELQKRVEEARSQVEDLGNDVQALSHRLHSSKLEILGLAKTTTSFCKELSEHQGVKIDLHAENVPLDLPREVSLCLFRVLQEALQNAAKHSGVTHFEVSLIARSSEIELTVHDSGIGFDAAEGFNGRGLGLTSMKERLKLVAGELSVQSRIGTGTTIRATVPLQPGPKSVAAQADRDQLPLPRRRLN